MVPEPRARTELIVEILLGLFLGVLWRARVNESRLELRQPVLPRLWREPGVQNAVHHPHGGVDRLPEKGLLQLAFVSVDCLQLVNQRPGPTEVRLRIGLQKREHRRDRPAAIGERGEVLQEVVKTTFGVLLRVTWHELAEAFDDGVDGIVRHFG